MGTRRLRTENARCGKSVLVVEDEPAILDCIRYTLEGVGLRVRTAADGLEGLDEVRRQRPDVVLLDMRLPGLHGTDLGRRIRDLYGAEFPIVVMSADGNSLVKAQALGACGYLRKPFDLDQLIQMVSQAAARPSGVQQYAGRHRAG